MKTKQIPADTHKIVTLALRDALIFQRERDNAEKQYEAAKQRLRKLMVNANWRTFTDADKNTATVFTALTRHYSVARLEKAGLKEYLELKPNSEALRDVLEHVTDKALVKKVKACITLTVKRDAILVKPTCKKDCKNCQCSGKKGKA